MHSSGEQCGLYSLLQTAGRTTLQVNASIKGIFTCQFVAPSIADVELVITQNHFGCAEARSIAQAGSIPALWDHSALPLEADMSHSASDCKEISRAKFDTFIRANYVYVHVELLFKFAGKII